MKAGIICRNEPARNRAAGVTAIVQAAGSSSRMAPHNKLLREVGGVPLVRQAVLTALQLVDDVRVVIRSDPRDVGRAGQWRID